MKKWQEERNYRRIYNEAGEVIANIITVDSGHIQRRPIPTGCPDRLSR